jgi:hypothetical protein
MIDLNNEIKRIKKELLGERVCVESSNGETFCGILKFIGYNKFIPSWGIQVTIDRTPLSNINISTIKKYVEPSPTLNNMKNIKNFIDFNKYEKDLSSLIPTNILDFEKSFNSFIESSEEFLSDSDIFELVDEWIYDFNITWENFQLIIQRGTGHISDYRYLLEKYSIGDMMEPNQQHHSNDIDSIDNQNDISDIFPMRPPRVIN